MWNRLFNHVDIKKENVHILNGNAKDFVKECEDYEKAIKANGGIRLFVGGVGPDGHLAFNEPGSSLVSRTHEQFLTTDTIIANSRFFDHDVNLVPKSALSVGVATVMEADEVLILINGHNKAHGIGVGNLPVWNDVLGPVEEQGRNLVQYLSLVGDSLWKDDVECGDAVGHDHRKILVVDGIDVADFTYVFRILLGEL
jgi:6-phosphogluconolactonase/Glucosamine-6-phosphate isomerase/deaminase